MQVHFFTCCCAAAAIVPVQCLACADAELDLSGPVWQAVDAEARDLVSVMLEKDPARRPSAQALLVSHSKWLNKGSAKQQQMEPPQQGPAACAPGIS